MDKPAGFTSFDVVAKLRGICETRRIGHTGTLDPMATGVLPIFIGNAAKAVDLQQNHDKTYEATLLLGTCTDTGDVTGTVLEQQPVPNGIDEAAVRAVLPQFVGAGQQIPPMYSAVKVDGQPLYKAARAGKTVARVPRPVVIYEIEYLNSPAPNQFLLRIRCGKGTYVRVLLEDIAVALGTVGTMQALRRTEAGAYTLAMAHTFDAVQAAKNAGQLPTLLAGVDTVFAHLPAVQVDAETRARLLNGAPTFQFSAQDGDCRAYFEAEAEFIGLCNVQDNVLRAKKLFVERG